MRKTAKRGPAAVLTMIALAASMASCALLHPAGGLPLGTPIAQAPRSIGEPTGSYPLPGGGTRLEYAQGSFGRQTWMLDFDAAGRLVSKDQVLDETHFASIEPGLTRDQLLFRIGHPAWVFGVGRQNLDVWNYRFAVPLGCTIFQVSVLRTGIVKEAAQGYDPACDAPNGYL